MSTRGHLGHLFLRRRVCRLASARIRFAEAVPGRRDRRDLRRGFRRAMRSTRTEQKAAVAVLLDRLVTGRVPIAAMTAGSAVGSEVVEFAGGVRLLLDVRDGQVAMHRLARSMPRDGIYLEKVKPALGSFWYRLWFSPPGGVEVLAKVEPAAGCRLTPDRRCPRKRRGSAAEGN